MMLGEYSRGIVYEFDYEVGEGGLEPLADGGIGKAWIYPS